jgi:hypothetical protein
LKKVSESLDWRAVEVLLMIFIKTQMLGSLIFFNIALRP